MQVFCQCNDQWDAHDGQIVLSEYESTEFGACPQCGMWYWTYPRDCDFPLRPPMYLRTSAYRFVEAMQAGTPKRYRAFLTWFDARDYAEMGAWCFVSDDGKSGFVIDENCELLSLFAADGSGQGGYAVQSAVRRGAIKLFCFAGFLPRFYRRYGFKVVSTAPWNDEYAPADWNYAKFGKPDVVWLRLVGV